MSQYLIAVMNGTQARFLTLEPAEVGVYNACPRLMEHESLLRNENKLSGQELWSSTKPGRNRGSAGQAHGYDDHREEHLAESERRFAQVIGDRLMTLIQTCQPQQFILVAEAQALGVIRELILPLLPKAIPIQEVSKDLCQLKPHELHDYLSAKALLPGRKRAMS
jgi:protein required for attachment to host cells